MAAKYLTLSQGSCTTLMIYIKSSKAAKGAHRTFPWPKAEYLDRDGICTFFGVPAAWPQSGRTVLIGECETYLFQGVSQSP